MTVSWRLFPEDVFGWLADTQPEQLAKRVKPDLTGEALAKAQRGVLATLVKALGADPKANGGTLSVLRRGFKDLNAQFQMCQFRPNTSLNETTAKKYDGGAAAGDAPGALLDRRTATASTWCSSSTASRSRRRS